MSQEEFIEKFHTLLPECKSEAAQLWYDFAAECVDMSQYVHFQAAESRDASIESWLNVLYEGLRQTKETLGAELAVKVGDLSCERCCLYPGEMLMAAECLREGDGAKEILEKIGSGEIDCTDLFSAVQPEDSTEKNCPLLGSDMCEEVRKMTADEVCEALRQKLRDRWSKYSAEVLGRPSEEIFERADEIAAAKFCYDQLTEKMTSYPAEYLEYLLRFQDPLLVVQDQWASEQNVDYSEDSQHALWTIQNTRDAEQDYPLDPDWMPLQDGPSMC